MCSNSHIIAGQPEVFPATRLLLAVDRGDPEGAAAEERGAGAGGHAPHQGHAREGAREGEEEVQVRIQGCQIVLMKPSVRVARQPNIKEICLRLEKEWEQVG